MKAKKGSCGFVDRNPPSFNRFSSFASSFSVPSSKTIVGVVIAYNEKSQPRHQIFLVLTTRLIAKIMVSYLRVAGVLLERALSACRNTPGLLRALRLL